MVEKKGDGLFLLGDIFDFYFEYKSFIPKNFFDVFYALRRIVEQGIHVHYWTGNHDFWVGEFFKRLGIKTHAEPTTLKMEGKRILVLHGDEVDTNFMLKNILCNKFSKFLFSLLHPEFGLLIARVVSKLSREKSKKFELPKRSLENFAERKFLKGIDTVIMGHFHIPYFYKRGKKNLVICGDWGSWHSYGVIENGNISLKRFSHSPK